MRYFKYVIIFFLLSALACEKKPEPTDVSDDPSKEKILDVVWQHIVYDDTSGGDYHSPKFTDDYVVFCSNLLWEDDGDLLGLVVLDKQSGERHASWDFEPNMQQETNEGINDFCLGGLDNEYVVINTAVGLHCYNIYTGQKIWSKEASQMYFESKITANDKYAFIGGSPRYGEDKWGKLIAYDLQTGSSKIILEENWNDGYQFTFHPPVTYISDNNDTILIFQKGVWLSGWERVDLIAYNLTQDSVYWRNDTIYGTSYEYGSSTLEPNIVGDKFIFQGRRSVHCYDIPSGNLLWKKLYPDEGFAQKRNLCADGKVFMVSETGNVF